MLDPWPPGQGARYTISFRELESSLRAAADLAGLTARVLHTGGARRSSRSGYRAAHSAWSWRLDRGANSI